MKKYQEIAAELHRRIVEGDYAEGEPKLKYTPLLCTSVWVPSVVVPANQNSNE